MYRVAAIILGALCLSTTGLRYDPDYVQWNLNQNQNAIHPSDYWGEWENHTFKPSPTNWRFPFYTLTLDRFVDGDPSNNNANGTNFEHDWMTNQIRFGGDTRGLLSSLDYLQGMGIKGIYIAGTPFINRPWHGNGYGVLDFTLLDAHHGVIDDWRVLITDIHRRDMYIIMDNTLGTMGDLIGFEGFLNVSAPFRWDEHNAVWKSDRRYHDFKFGNSINNSCQYPPMYSEKGIFLGNITDDLHTCRESDFDQYGDMKVVGETSVWLTQLTKFASVQDRLRVWRSDVLDKINVMSCMQIAMLDIDGFRIDKALQTTLDAHASFSSYQRQCARRRGKENFLIVGEAVGEVPFEALYFGRGRKPDRKEMNTTAAMLSSNESDPNSYLRKWGNGALDAAAFHYPTYGALTRFLGLDGPIGFEGVDFVDHWKWLLQTDDMVNSNTGEFDPRHLFGMSNQDIFRWPSLVNGIHRNLLGLFVTTLEMPGIPMLLWGEEQQFNVLENLSSDYVFGRSPMASSRAWQLHGCYKLGAEVYINMPFDSANFTCHDDNVSLDHRDPSHPVRNILKRMYELRRMYPSLNDGYNLTTLSTQIRDVFLPGSGNISTPTGLWSVYRGREMGVQDFEGQGFGNQGVWLVFHNDNRTVDYDFDCTNSSAALISAFPIGTTVKNLFYPYDEYTLAGSNVTYGIEGSPELSGCLSNFTLAPWGFKAFVPKTKWSIPDPTITSVLPKHDARIESSVAANEPNTIPIEIHFSSPMDCDSVKNSLTFSSTTHQGQIPCMNTSTINCMTVHFDAPTLAGGIATTWIFSANLTNVYDGVHTFTVNNASARDGSHTNTVDRFMFRIGQNDNPIIFPATANYTRGVLQQNPEGDLYIVPKAPGAEKFRYSTNWGSSWSDWTDYTGQNHTIIPQPWSGTNQQQWTGEHVILNFWSAKTGSSDHVQHSDLGRDDLPPRRWPHVSLHGSWNQYGYDIGLPNTMKQDDDGLWNFYLMAEYPTELVVNVWGMNPDGSPDKSAAYGDVNGDYVLDWLPPDSLSANILNISEPPPHPYLGYRVVINDGNYNYRLEPAGSAGVQLAFGICFLIIPLITAISGVIIYRQVFYQVKFNENGHRVRKGFRSLTEKIDGIFSSRKLEAEKEAAGISSNPDLPIIIGSLAAAAETSKRRSVLIATIEYIIEDWDIKVKIGGLGVMASLMAKNLDHQDLYWVVPCVGDIEYPFDRPGEIMTVTVCGKVLEVEVQYHKVRNITYILLDAPIFRTQLKADPYPPRMDELDSAIFYSAWNSCIAQALVRCPVDIYHVNDYHGALAPLYILPRTIPICLSLHNAEFQGLWPLKTQKDMDEICKVFNLPENLVREFVQFGEVFNLLHCAASYLRKYQNGFGAVGVSKKYGTRTFARYPIFWGLNRIGALPNPNPADTAEWNKKASLQEAQIVTIDEAVEAERGNFRRQAQKWAGLEEDPTAELFVFVGRWSKQKGVDLIADVFFSVLDENPKVQLICIGPLIDLYGKMAALKLEIMMKRYPTRVFSKPEFTPIPSFIHKGAEFALIPSRDEPFGLVAVEFGGSGALGVGANIGGLGQMPGWWYTIESTTTEHVIEQFKGAIRNALASKRDVRAMMRVRAGRQRFPVAEWVEQLEELQNKSIEEHFKPPSKLSEIISLGLGSLAGSLRATPASTVMNTAVTSRIQSRAGSRPNSRPLSPAQSRSPSPERGLCSSRIGPSSLARLPHERQIRVDGSFWPSDLPSRRNSVQGNSKPRQTLSIQAIVGEQADFNLQRTDPLFTDSNNEYYDRFERQLETVSARNSETKLCIEKFLEKSEKEWFGQRHNAKLGKSNLSTPAASLFRVPKFGEADGSENSQKSRRESDTEASLAQFDLGKDFMPFKGMKRIMQLKIGDWQVYTILLAFGQILAANSYQINLITGESNQAANKLYVVASIYFLASIFWWIIFRRLRSIWVLATPFAFYGASFFFLGIAPYASNLVARGWIHHIATGAYAIASASGSFFFALNFGSEGGAPVRSWIFRACAVQGTQQIYIILMWYWGSRLTKFTAHGCIKANLITSTPVMTAITVPIALLLWTIGLIVYFGLPDFYSQKPGKVPQFYKSLKNRKIVLWFFLAVVLQNYFLSAPYGRNWRYLFSSSLTPGWSIFLIVIFFFLIVWFVMLWAFSVLSRKHSWILPIFAIGLLAPRWCQMLWGTSNIGLYIPWGGPTIGALLGRCLWAWLGLLDQLQGVGFGMILLLTLTRFHITFTLVAAQAIGSLATIAARASAPNNVGPGPVFPNFSAGWRESLSTVSFWMGLLTQLIICVGFFKFFRKEQLWKP